jgi:hypothetical protein
VSRPMTGSQRRSNRAVATAPTMAATHTTNRTV